MLGLSEVSRRTPDDSLDAAKAVAAAQQVRHALIQDGPAPSASRILEQMGRDSGGYPLSDEPKDISAHQAARQLLDDGVEV